MHARVCEASVSVLSMISSGNLCYPSSGMLHWEVSSHFSSQGVFVFMWGESLVAQVFFLSDVQPLDESLNQGFSVQAVVHVQMYNGCYWELWVL